jgi:hypothetical protein
MLESIVLHVTSSCEGCGCCEYIGLAVLGHCCFVNWDSPTLFAYFLILYGKPCYKYKFFQNITQTFVAEIFLWCELWRWSPVRCVGVVCVASGVVQILLRAPGWVGRFAVPMTRSIRGPKLARHFALTVQVLTFTLGCNSLCIVLVVWNQFPVVLGVDVGWDAGLQLVKILASAKCGLRLLFTPQGEYRGIWIGRWWLVRGLGIAIVMGGRVVTSVINNAVERLLCCCYFVNTLA